VTQNMPRQCDTEMLQQCDTEMLQQCDTEMLQQCDTEMLQQCDTEMLQQCDTVTHSYSPVNCRMNSTTRSVHSPQYCLKLASEPECQ